jgi:hypothetical protein
MNSKYFKKWEDNFLVEFFCNSLEGSIFLIIFSFIFFIFVLIYGLKQKHYSYIIFSFLFLYTIIFYTINIILNIKYSKKVCSCNSCDCKKAKEVK